MKSLTIRRAPPGLGRCERGATIIEFAVVTPILMMFLMAVSEVGYQLYVSSVLSGEVNVAGRKSALETASEDERTNIDASLEAAVRNVVPNANINISRVAYRSYGRAQAQAEAFTDTNGNGVCDAGEAFDDANRNGTRDTDSGQAGQGSAKDVTIYTVNLRYKRLFPFVHGALGWGDEVSIRSRTLMRNQPFDKQPEPLIGKCT